MDTPAEPGADPLRAPSPSNFAPGHLERVKLVKLEGSPRGAGMDCRAVCPGAGGRAGQRSQPLAPCSGLVPAPRLAQDPLYDVPDAAGGQAGGPQRPGRTVSLRERLLLTRPVWLQLRANAAAALHVLRTEPPGVSLAPAPWDLPSEGGRKRAGPEPPALSICRRSWCGGLTLASAKHCACGCLRPAAPPSFPAITSRKALGVRGTGLEGRGWTQSGQGAGRFPRELHFPSLRRLLGRI